MEISVKQLEQPEFVAKQLTGNGVYPSISSVYLLAFQTQEFAVFLVCLGKFLKM